MTNELHQDLKVYGKIETTDKENTLLGIGAESPNLFDYTKINSITVESEFGNVTITNNNNGSFTCSGSNSTDAHIIGNYFTTILSAGTYYISQISGSKFFVGIFDSISPNYHLIASSNQSFTLNETKQVWIYITIRNTTSVTETISPMLVKGSIAPTVFQSYTGKIQHDINQSYSYKEIDTGATWVDGKKIYKLTYENNNSFTVNPDNVIYIQEVKPNVNVINIELVVIDNANIKNYNMEAQLNVNSLSIINRRTTVLTISKIIITIYYTK